MKNVTISMDDDLHRKVRVDAATAGMSVSRYVAKVLSQGDDEDMHARRKTRLKADLAALQAVFDGPKLPLSVDGRMPDADERNARR